jgi:hypothetical protein
MIWDPQGIELPTDYLGDLDIVDILVDFEGPRSFLARDSVGAPLFAHQCGESSTVWRYAVVPFSDQLTDSLLNGRVDLYTALSQPRLWLVDIDLTGKVVRCVAASFEQLPETSRPQPGVTLYPEHEPLLSLRASGPLVELGRASIGLLHDQLGNVKTGLRHLAEAVLGRNSKGQPAKEVRRYYDLPAILQPGSIQVSVFPQTNVKQLNLFKDDEVWSDMRKLLETGLLLLNGQTNRFEQLDGASAQAVLKAMYAFAPATRGEVIETTLSGQLASLPVSQTRMTRKARTDINQRLQHSAQPEAQVFELEGIISELDLEVGTCLLRDESGTTISKLRFVHDLEVPEPLFELVRQSFDTSERVEIVGLGYSRDEVFLMLVRPITRPSSA